MESQHEYLKVDEVAKVLRIARSRAYELVAEGQIPAVRIGRSVRVPRHELDQWIANQRYVNVRKSSFVRWRRGCSRTGRNPDRPH